MATVCHHVTDVDASEGEGRVRDAEDYVALLFGCNGKMGSLGREDINEDVERTSLSRCDDGDLYWGPRNVIDSII